MNDIQPIIDALQDKLPWLAALTTVMGILRLIAKPLSALVQSFFTKLLLYVQGTPETDDDAWVERILASKWYRAFAFVVDWVLSIKLPTSASVQKVMENPPISPPLTLLLLCGLLSFGVVGCASLQSTPPTREAVVYYAFRDTWSGAHEAYKGFCELVVLGKVSKADEADVDKAWNRFRVGFKAALLAANNDWSAVTPASVIAQKDDLITLIRAL